MYVLEPAWNPKDKYFSFLLIDAPTWTQVSDVSPPTPDATTDLSGLLYDFIGQTRDAFMTPLHMSVLVPNLVNTWDGWGQYASARPPSSAVSRIIWRPREIRISTFQHEIVWKMESVEAAPVRIPPGFGGTANDVPATEPTRTVTIVPSGPEDISPERRVDLGMELLEATDDIPYEAESTLDDKPDGELMDQRHKEKKKLDKARAQVALAKLRTQRLIEKYMEKYGSDLEVTESESDSEF